MVSKICFLKNYYGGDCLHSYKPNPGSKAQSGSDDENHDWVPNLPDKFDVEVPLVYYQRRIPEGNPRIVREATPKEVLDLESASQIKSIGEVEPFEVIDEKITRSGDTKIVNHSAYNKAAHAYNEFKGAPLKVNAALTALDAANFYLEHKDEFDNVVDFASAYGQEIVEGTVAAAQAAAEYAAQGDIPNLAVTGASIIGVPVVTRTIDNVADVLGVEGVNTTDATMDAIHSATGVLQDMYNEGRPSENPFVVPNPITAIVSGFIKRWF